MSSSTFDSGATAARGGEPGPARRVLGAVIAGGRGARLGGLSKAKLEVAGEPLLARTVRVLAEALGHGAPVLVAVADAAQAEDLASVVRGSRVEVRFVLDAVGASGPMAGIASCLDAAVALGATDVVLVAVDLPRLDARAVRWLAESHPAAVALVPRRAGMLQSLAARYATSLAPDVAERLRTRRLAVRAFVEAVRPVLVEVDSGEGGALALDGVLEDVDGPDDAARLGVSLPPAGRAP